VAAGQAEGATLAPVVDREGRELLDRQARRYLGLSGDEFLRPGSAASWFPIATRTSLASRC
jgi:hypothetical protein